MNNQDERWAVWVQFLAGFWLIISPWILGYQEDQIAMVNAIVIGIIIGAVAIVQAAAARKPKKKPRANKKNA